MPDLELKQVRSSNGASGTQRATLRSLKLGRIGAEAEEEATKENGKAEADATAPVTAEAVAEPDSGAEGS